MLLEMKLFMLRGNEEQTAEGRTTFGPVQKGVAEEMRKGKGGWGKGGKREGG